VETPEVPEWRKAWLHGPDFNFPSLCSSRCLATHRATHRCIGHFTNDGHLISSPRLVGGAVLDAPELSPLAIFLHPRAIDQTNRVALHEHAHPLIDSSDREKRLAGLGRNRQLVCRLQTNPCDARIRPDSPTTTAFGFAGVSVGWVRVIWAHRQSAGAGLGLSACKGKIDVQRSSPVQLLASKRTGLCSTLTPPGPPLHTLAMQKERDMRP